MTPSRPYLLRAIHDWIVDNNLTPQLVVDAGVEGVQVPPEHVREGRIVLNVAASAVRDLTLGNEWIEFGARFGGVPRQILLPTKAVLAVYARENGVGMAFQEQEPDGEPPEPGGSKPERPSLRVVK